MAEDDADDRFLLNVAAKKSGLPIKVLFVENGRELINYLFQKTRYEGSDSAPRPDIILLDLNMPVKHGMDALREIKRDKFLQSIPVVIWSTSNDADSIRKATGLGACHYVVKPQTLKGLSEALKGALEKCIGKFLE